MALTQLALCDPDIRYSTRLVRTLEKRTDFPCAVRLFSSLLLCLEALEKQPVDLLLLSTACLPEMQTKTALPAKNVLLLGDRAQAEAADYPLIDKYQPIGAVTQEIFLYMSPPEVRPLAETDGNVLGIYAPCSGLRTAAAFTSALLLAKKQSTVFLSLDDVPQVPGQTETQSDLSDLLYYLQTDASLARNAFREARTMVGPLTTLSTPKTNFDLYDIPAESFRKLFSFLFTQAGMTTLVLDLGNGLGKLPFFLSLCTHLYLPTSRDSHAAKKLQRFEAALPEICPGIQHTVGTGTLCDDSLHKVPVPLCERQHIPLPEDVLSYAQTNDPNQLLQTPLAVTCAAALAKDGLV